MKDNWFSVSEKEECLRMHLQSFLSTADYQRSENDKNVFDFQIIDSYIKEQLSIEQGMKEWMEYEIVIHKSNQRLLRAIKKVKGNTFYKYLLEIIEQSEGMKGKAIIVDTPTGKYQDEKYGRQIKGYWVQQWSVGMEGDSFEGNVYVEIKPNKYLKFGYSV